MVERQDIRHSVIDELGLIEQGLAMKCGEVFIEVHGEEVQAGYSSLQGFRVLMYYIVVELGAFELQTPCLLKASCIARHKQYRNPFDLRLISLSFVKVSSFEGRASYLRVFVEASLAEHVQGVFAGESRVLCVKIREFDINWSRPTHIASFGV